MRFKRHMAAFLFLLAFASGCANDPFNPERAAVLSAPTAEEGEAEDADIRTLLDEYDGAPDDRRAAIRNEVVRRSMTLIDSRFGEFERDLHANRAFNDLGFDLLNLALSFSGTISNGEQAKTVLSALVTAVTGTKLAINKNLFNEQATTAIAAKMKELRSQERLRIAGRLGQDAETYPLYPDALQDLHDYYRAGTLLGALSNITATSTAKAQTNKLLGAALQPGQRIDFDAAGEPLLFDRGGRVTRPQMFLPTTRPQVDDPPPAPQQ